MQTIPDRLDRRTFQELEKVSRPTATSRLNQLEESGVLKTAQMKGGRGRPKKLYMINRERYRPERPQVGNFEKFLKPLTELEKDFDLKYALGAPFSSSAHGRVAYHPPLKVYVEHSGTRLVTELYSEHLDVTEILAGKEEVLSRRGSEYGLPLLSPEDTVALLLSQGREEGFRRSTSHTDAASVLLRKGLVEEVELDIPYLCRRAVEEKSTSALLQTDELLRNEFEAAFLTENWRNALRPFASSEPDPSLEVDLGVLERLAQVPGKYFESDPWARFFGVTELG